MLNISEIAKASETIAQEFNLKRIVLFGSYAEGRNSEQSDVDLLVEFKDGYASLLTLSTLKLRFEEILNKEVDIIRLPIPDGALINPQKVVEIYAA